MTVCGPVPGVIQVNESSDCEVWALCGREAEGRSFLVLRTELRAATYSKRLPARGGVRTAVSSARGVRTGDAWVDESRYRCNAREVDFTHVAPSHRRPIDPPATPTRRRRLARSRSAFFVGQCSIWILVNARSMVHFRRARARPVQHSRRFDSLARAARRHLARPGITVDHRDRSLAASHTR